MKSGCLNVMLISSRGVLAVLGHRFPIIRRRHRSFENGIVYFLEPIPKSATQLAINRAVVGVVHHVVKLLWVARQVIKLDHRLLHPDGARVGDIYRHLERSAGRKVADEFEPLGTNAAVGTRVGLKHGENGVSGRGCTRLIKYIGKTPPFDVAGSRYPEKLEQRRQEVNVAESCSATLTSRDAAPRPTRNQRYFDTWVVKKPFGSWELDPMIYGKDDQSVP